MQDDPLQASSQPVASEVASLATPSAPSDAPSSSPSPVSAVPEVPLLSGDSDEVAANSGESVASGGEAPGGDAVEGTSVVPGVVATGESKLASETESKEVQNGEDGGANGGEATTAGDDASQPVDGAPSRAEPGAPTDETKPPATGEEASASTELPAEGAATAPAPTPSPAPAATLAPPAPSVSPAPGGAPKKFTSSLSVNKKFLEKAGEKAKPEAKATIPRHATPPLQAPVSTSHPRLFTGKISASTSVSLTTTQAGPGITGWNKTPAGASGDAQRGSLPTQQEAARAAGAFDRGGSGSAFGQNRAKGGAVWGARSSSHGPGGGGVNFGGDFPTAAEAMQAKQLRAAALMEQMQSRDRAVQARAAASAAANAHLLENLDAFRGIHLDPNASHWDEMGDEDSDFLDETIEFGDGTQYKIETDPAALAAASEELVEPHPSDLATLEAPLAPGEVIPEPSREERFKDDYDRTWPKRQPEAKNLFNERLGRFEPHSGTKASPSTGAILTHEQHLPAKPVISPPPSANRAGVDHPPHLDRAPHGRRESITSPRLGTAPLPPRDAWGRGNDWRDGGTGGAAAPRRASIEHKGRRPSVETSARPTGIEQGGRQLPPHLAAAAIPRQDHPPARSALVQPPPPPPSQAPPSTTAPPPPAPAPALVQPTPVSPPAPELDLNALTKETMHAAAEKAKLRRQEEEKANQERIERAKKKAAELEEKARLAAEAAKAAAAPAPSAEARRPSANGVAPERVESSWRRPLPVAAPPGPAHIAPAAKPEPTQILSRDATRSAPKPTPSAILTKPVAPAEPAVSPSTSAAVPPSGPRAAPAPPPPITTAKPAPPPDSRVWRRPEPAPRPPAPASATQPPSAAPRQPPPHLATSQEPAPVPAPSAAVQAPAEVESKPVAINVEPTPTPTPTTILKASPPTASATSQPRKTSNPPAPAALKPFKKVPQLSEFDNVMLKIKGVMGKEADPSQATSVASTPAAPLPTSPPTMTVKLPTKTLVHGTASPSAQAQAPVAAPSAPPTPSQPPVGGQRPIPAAPRGRVNPRQPVRPAPVLESREPPQMFETSRVERSPSPPPAWRAYSITLPAHPARPPAKAALIHAFFKMPTIHTASPLDILSWQPPIRGLSTRTLSRDDLFFPKSFHKGVVITPIKVPTRRITRKTSMERDDSWGRVESGAGAAIREADALAKAKEVELNATTAPDAAALFDLGPVRPSSLKSKLPVGSSIAFYRPGTSSPSEVVTAAPEEKAVSSETSGPFMVTKELDGEVVEMTPKKSLAAPGDDGRTTPSNEVASTPFDNLDVPTPSQSQTLAPPSPGSWSAKSPLGLSVLNPAAPSVWAPAATDAPVHSRSISLSGAKPENSLQGIIDPDDFPAAAIPSSVADLKSEDEGSTEEGKHDDLKAPSKDHARLRAAAPSFSSYQEAQSLPASLYSSRLPTVSRELPPPAPLPSSFSQPFLSPNVPSNLQGSQYGQSQQYPSFSMPPQTMSGYTNPMQAQHQGYPQSLFNSPLSPTPQPLFPSYRPAAPGITNPALIANYGYGAIGGSGNAYGAVGGNTHNRGGYHQQSPYLAPQQTPYRIADQFGDARQQAYSGYSTGVASPAPPHHPHSPYPTHPQSYNGAFSPPVQNMPGVIGRGGRRQF